MLTLLQIKAWPSLIANGLRRVSVVDACKLPLRDIPSADEDREGVVIALLPLPDSTSLFETIFTDTRGSPFTEDDAVSTFSLDDADGFKE